MQLGNFQNLGGRNDAREVPGLGSGVGSFVAGDVRSDLKSVVVEIA